METAHRRPHNCAYESVGAALMSATGVALVAVSTALAVAGAQLTGYGNHKANRGLQITIQNSAPSNAGFPPCCRPVGGLIVFDGDSVSRGLRASAGKTPDRQLAAMLPRPAIVQNVAVSGLPVFKALARYGTTITPLRDPDQPYEVIAFHAGDNDILAGMTAAQTYASFTAYVARAHADGWLVIVTTELQQPKLWRARQLAITDYDRLLVANAAGADAVIDMAGYCGFGDAAQRGNRAYFAADGVHPSDNGYKLLAQMLIISMEKLALFPADKTMRPTVAALPQCAP